MRFVLDLRHTDQGVEGEVIREGAAAAEPFSGWLELLRLLEVPEPSTPGAAEPDPPAVPQPSTGTTRKEGAGVAAGEPEARPGAASWSAAGRVRAPPMRLPGCFMVMLRWWDACADSPGPIPRNTAKAIESVNAGRPRRMEAPAEWVRATGRRIMVTLLSYSPAVVADAAGRLRLFVLGRDGVLYHMTQRHPTTGGLGGGTWETRGGADGSMLNAW
jgi:hypothetical protein